MCSGVTASDLRHVRDYYQTMLDGIRSAQQQGLTMEQAKARFAVPKKFPRFFQRQSAQWAKAKEDRNIKALWHILGEADQQLETRNKEKVTTKEIIVTYQGGLRTNGSELS